MGKVALAVNCAKRGAVVLEEHGAVGWFEEMLGLQTDPEQSRAGELGPPKSRGARIPPKF